MKTNKTLEKIIATAVNHVRRFCRQMLRHASRKLSPNALPFCRFVAIQFIALDFSGLRV
jgi:hypothetical protein